MVQRRTGKRGLGRRVGAASAALFLGVRLLLATSRLSADEGLPAALARLGSDSAEERRAAAEAVESLGSTGSRALEELATQLNGVAKSTEWRPPRPAADAHQAGNKEADLLESLVQQKPDPAATRALATVCLMRALVRVGTTPAVRLLLHVPSDRASPFRAELFRDLKQLDDRASAALIELHGDASSETRTWAKDVLEALGKRTPGDTVQTTNDQVLVDVLHAYATIHDLDALPVVLSFVNSERLPVRAAAREAILAYGPDAEAKVRTTYAAVTGERAADNVDAADVARTLFDAYDRYRLRDVYARLEAGLAKQRGGDIEGAIADFDNVLARQPLLDRGKDIVAAYVEYAEAIEPSDHSRAKDYLRRALRLAMDQASPRLNHIESEIRFLDGADRMSQGIVDTAPFEQALVLDPSNSHARAQLNRLRADATARREREGRIAAAVGAAGLTFLTVGLFALRIHRRRFVRPAR